MTVPLLIKTIYSGWVGGLRLVVSIEAVLGIERGVLTDVLYVDGDFWGRGEAGWLSL